MPVAFVAEEALEEAAALGVLRPGNKSPPATPAVLVAAPPPDEARSEGAPGAAASRIPFVTVSIGAAGVAREVRVGETRRRRGRSERATEKGRVWEVSVRCGSIVPAPALRTDPGTEGQDEELERAVRVRTPRTLWSGWAGARTQALLQRREHRFSGSLGHLGISRRLNENPFHGTR